MGEGSHEIVYGGRRDSEREWIWDAERKEPVDIVWKQRVGEFIAEREPAGGLILTYGMATRHACYAPATRPLLAVDFSHENPIIARYWRGC